jgi:hypothetical protein
MTMTLHETKKITKDLEKIYNIAMEKQKYHIALIAIIHIAKLNGLLQKRRIPKIERIKDMTEGELLDFLQILRENDPEARRAETLQEKEETYKRRKEIDRSSSAPGHAPPDKALN